jgi:lysozyme
MDHADAFANGKDIANFKEAYAWGIRGVIHKATEGERFVDPLYAARRARALAAGLLWGAYHFGRPGDPGNQASAFLTAAPKGAAKTIYLPPSLVDDEKNFVRLCYDFEDEHLGLWQAEHFLDLIHMTTRQYGWLYSGFLVRDLLQKRGTGAELSPYHLWLAEYSTVARVPRVWKNYVLWQRSGDGQGPGPHDIPGIGHKQDVDYFDGTDQQLRAAWYGATEI